MAENNYILLLTITGFALQYRWLTDRRSTLPVVGVSFALGLNLLTRITTVLDILGAACFPAVGNAIRSTRVLSGHKR